MAGTECKGRKPLGRCRVVPKLPSSPVLPRGTSGVATAFRVRVASCRGLRVLGRQRRKNASPGGGTRKDKAQLRQRSKWLGRDWGGGVCVLGSRKSLTLTSVFSFSLFTSSCRKPSFPFQWAWESFIIDGQTLLQQSSSVALGHRSLLLPPAAPQLKSRLKSVASLSEDTGFGQKTEVQTLERRHQLGGCSSITLPVGKAESQGLDRCSQGGFCPPGKGSGSESEDVLEGQNAEVIERVQSPGELPQLPGRGLILEEEWISEVTEEEENRAPRRRKGSSYDKGRNSGEKASEEGELQGHSQRSSSSSNSLQKSQRGKPRAKDLKGPWDLERLHRQLQEELDCGECSWEA